MTPHYYVYRPGYSGPTVRHPTAARAAQEAERLAQKHPGVTFEILMAIATVTAPPPPPVIDWAPSHQPRTLLPAD